MLSTLVYPITIYYVGQCQLLVKAPSPRLRDDVQSTMEETELQHVSFSYRHVAALRCSRH